MRRYRCDATRPLLFSVLLILGSLGLTAAVSTTPFATALDTQDCEMQVLIQGEVRMGCPPLNDCPAFDPCGQHSFAYQGGTVLACTCGGQEAPVPICCKLVVDVGHPLQFKGHGACGMYNCPPGDSCEAEFVPFDPEEPLGDGFWEANCTG